MTENHIKESLSVRFIQLVANYNGFTTNQPEKDYGTDISIVEQKAIESANGKRRYFDTGKELKVQAKSTTLSSVKINNGVIKYDLEADTYNTLVERRNNFNKPLILFLFLLPTDKIDWLSISSEELAIRKCAYWYLPEQNATPTTNKSTITIDIEELNLITIDSFVKLFEDFNN